jgi:septum formation protein
LSQTKLLVLASSSPRRKELLALGGWLFNIAPAEIDETPFSEEEPRQYVLRMAESKARTVAARQFADHLVVAADTIVVDSRDKKEQILGKPADAVEAADMLLQLRGHQHFVYTAIAVMQVTDSLLLTDLCATQVPMRNYTDQEIQAYIDTGDPLDKAGAYAIQHAEFNPVQNLRGCYANVVGLPLCHLTRTLMKVGVKPEADIPGSCQAALHYACPVYNQVLCGGYNSKEIQ